MLRSAQERSAVRLLEEWYLLRARLPRVSVAVAAAEAKGAPADSMSGAEVAATLGPGSVYCVIEPRVGVLS